MYDDHLAGLPLEVADCRLKRRERETSSGFTRVTTTFVLEGPATDGRTDPDGRTAPDGRTTPNGHTTPHARTAEQVVGRGEDVTYDDVDHDRLAAEPPAVPLGSFTLEEYSAALDDVTLFSTEPEREASGHYRRWAVESAALDLALKQAGTDLASALGREYRPLSFVVSTRFEDDADASARLDRLESIDPNVAFKLDPTPDWSDALVERLAASGRVRILDLKGLYEDVDDLESSADPEFYRRLLDAFPAAVFEDPETTPTTRPVLESHADRLSWDYPITGVESVEALPFEPAWLNVKPSRFGTVRSLFETVEWARVRDVDLYAGGQFELGPGRGHVQAIASVCFPDGPNDIAPRGYNDPELAMDLPRTPLEPPAEPTGLGFGSA